MEMYNNEKLVIDWDDDDKNYNINGYEKWVSPSNLAIIKYWGKEGNQIPKNPSISMTLSEANTTTTMEWYYRVPDEETVTFFYNEKENKAFADRIVKFLGKVEHMFPFIDDLQFVIHSKNSFPHGAGIASSASGLSAIALCLCKIEQYFFDTLESDEDFYRKASYASRLGSGSACRSVYGGWVEWGKSDVREDFSDLYGTPVSEIHPTFRDMKDTILIASNKEKSVSSTAGHKLMENNDYAEIRYQQAKNRLPELMKALQDGDWATFGKIAENEALTLHALMMSSEDSYILMEPASLQMIELIRQYRKETGHHVYFSLDAGPNIHMLYPADIDTEVRKFVNSKLKKLCQGGKFIYDHVGYGPEYYPNED